MENDLEIRLQADRVFVSYLCALTGRSASALATLSGIAATTLNRYVSRKSKPASTLKDSTIEKIARRWNFDYLELSAYRKKIENAIREGKPVSDADPERMKSGRRVAKIVGFREALPAQSLGAPARDPLMDQIMGATYEVWFGGYQQQVEFETLPDFVRLLYGRAKVELKAPTAAEIKKRAADMLAAASMKSGKKK